MRTVGIIGIAFCFLALGCSRPRQLLTDDQATKVCMAFMQQSGIIANRPVLVMEQNKGNLRIFRFMTNSVLSASQIVVDRVTGTAKLE
jgi:hypothetical protein